MAAKKTESKQQMADLKAQLSEKKLQKLYLFFGEETFLIDLNISRICELVPHMDFPEFNRIMITSDTPLAEVSDSLESFPMMAEKKLVIINDSGAFKAKAAADLKEFYTRRIENIAEDTVVIFRESEVDKRSTVYKAAVKHGWVGEFTHLDDTDLITWVMREAKNLGSKISKDNAQLLISISDRSLLTLKNELEKLCAYSKDEITAPTIERLASRSLEAKVFDLCDYMIQSNTGMALCVLEELKTNKESPFGILYMIFSTYSKMLKCKVITERHEPYEAYPSLLGVPKFSVKKYTDGAKKFSKSELSRILMLAIELDLSVKRGEIPQWQAVEKLVVEGSERRKNG